MPPRSQTLVHPTWRIAAGLLLVQVPGIAVGLVVKPVGADWFMNCWYGGAFSMPIGFVLGLLWQTGASVDTWVRFRWHVLGYGLFAALMPIVGVLSFHTWAGG